MRVPSWARWRRWTRWRTFECGEESAQHVDAGPLSLFTHGPIVDASVGAGVGLGVAYKKTLTTACAPPSTHPRPPPGLAPPPVPPPHGLLHAWPSGHAPGPAPPPPHPLALDELFARTFRLLVPAAGRRSPRLPLTRCRRASMWSLTQGRCLGRCRVHHLNKKKLTQFVQHTGRRQTDPGRRTAVDGGGDGAGVPARARRQKGYDSGTPYPCGSGSCPHADPGARRPRHLDQRR